MPCQPLSRLSGPTGKPSAPPDNGTTRSLPNAGDPVSGTSPGVDRQVESATLRSEETWDELAQGDPKAAYDLLRRLIGDQGGGS
jgi:hypothetical protein